jgi:hypothetical protein
MKRIEKFLDAVEREGILYSVKRIIPHLHQTNIRPHLPRKSDETQKLNGVDVRSGRLLDSIVPWRVTHPDPKNYESAIVEALNQHVNEGDTVCIVGGGWGVTSVIAARRVGSEGIIHTFEASDEYSKYISETTEINGVEGRVDVENAIVSNVKSHRGATLSERVIDPVELPECDVLQLDCEGAELDILDNMTICPRVIIVESHGIFDSSSSSVADVLRKKSYKIISEGPAEDGKNRKKCDRKDIMVLVGVKI